MRRFTWRIFVMEARPPCYNFFDQDVLMKPYADYTLRLERLLDVCRKSGDKLSVDAYLQEIVRTGAELTSSTGCSILTYAEEERCLRFVAALEGEIDALRGVSVPLDRSVAGWVYRRQLGLVTSQAEADARIHRVADRELANGTHALLAVPMFFRGRCVGVMEAVNKAEDYTEEDVRAVELLAAMAAGAIENQRLLQESQSACEQMMAVDRMKDDFLAIASHELRTPLTAILDGLEQAAAANDGQLRTTLGPAVKAAERLRSVIEQMMDSDRLEKGLGQLQQSDVDVLELVNEIAAGVQAEAESHAVRLVVEPVPFAVFCRLDPEKTGMALHNVLQNAIQFNQPGGEARVRVCDGETGVQICVEDTGIGIPAEALEKVFTRFYQVESHLTRRHGGMGPGLAVAREMMELQGGRIWAENRAEGGSRFTLELPRAQGEAGF